MRPSRQLALGAGLVGAGLGLGVLISTIPANRTGDLALARWLTSHRHEALNDVATTINLALGPRYGLLLACAAGLALSASAPRGRRTTAARAYTVVTAAAWESVNLAKALFGRVRPDAAIVHPYLAVTAHHDSYPSGHTAVAVATTAGALALTRSLGRRPAPVWAIGLPLVAATAWSRVYVGAHYPTDVVGSMLFGAGAALVADAALARWRRRRADDEPPPNPGSPTSARVASSS